MQGKDLYDKNFQFWEKETGEDIRQWRGLPCSLIARTKNKNGHLT